MNDAIAEAASRHARRVLWAELAGGALAWVAGFCALVGAICWMFGVTG